MSFTPAIPMAGLAGWRFLERTADSQRAAFESGAVFKRETAYFTENIGKVKTAEALVKDRRLLAVALGAFGLEGEIDKKFFIRKVLQEGTEGSRSFANRLSDPNYRKLAAAFGFGNATGAQTNTKGFAEAIIEQYKVRKFEAAVGDVNNSMRLAMNFRREIGTIAAGPDNAGWYSILGSKPLREVVQTALRLPKEFARIDVDRQKDMIQQRMASSFGDKGMAFFREPANVEKVITRFLAMAQLNEAAATAATSPALQLLQGVGGDSSGLYNLFASQR